MTAHDWTSPEGRAELRRRFRINGGYVLGSLRITVGGEPIELAIEAAMGATLPLLDALEAAERERDEARSLVSALRDGIVMLRTFRCQHDPPCSEVNRGAFCNSCWARSWAEDVRLP